jgi:2-polyprenyl-3-methyl-5-hydroxy-6-metoxy-1,4-benzoquinol methylase
MPSTARSDEIAADFDEIARLSPSNADFSDAQAWVLRNLPAQTGAALEIGCGVGDLSRLISSRFSRTDAIDLSRGMIEEARRRTSPGTSLQFTQADMFEWLAARPSQYDCIVTVTTVHHVDFSLALTAIARALRPTGRLLVIDIVDRSAARYMFVNVVASAFGALRELLALFRRRSSLKLRRAYRRHAERETYLTVADVRKQAASLLPGSVVSTTLFWRYRLIWEKRRS